MNTQSPFNQLDHKIKTWVKKFLPAQPIKKLSKKLRLSRTDQTQKNIDVLEKLIFPRLSVSASNLYAFYHQLLKKDSAFRRHFILPLLSLMAKAGELFTQTENHKIEISRLQEKFKMEQEDYKTLVQQINLLEGMNTKLPAFDNQEFLVEMKRLANLHESMESLQSDTTEAHAEINQLRDHQSDKVTQHVEFLKKMHAELIQYLERCRNKQNKSQPATRNPAQIADEIIAKFYEKFNKKNHRNNHVRFIKRFMKFIKTQFDEIEHCVPWYDYFAELNDVMSQFYANYLDTNDQLIHAINQYIKQGMRLDEAIQMAQASVQKCSNFLEKQQDLLSQWHKGLGPLPGLPRPGHQRGPGTRPD